MCISSTLVYAFNSDILVAHALCTVELARWHCIVQGRCLFRLLGVLVQAKSSAVFLQCCSTKTAAKLSRRYSSRTESCLCACRPAAPSPRPAALPPTPAVPVAQVRPRQVTLVKIIAGQGLGPGGHGHVQMLCLQKHGTSPDRMALSELLWAAVARRDVLSQDPACMAPPAEQAVLQYYVLPAGRSKMLGSLECYCLVPKGAKSSGGQAYLDAGHAEKLLHGA